MINSYSEREHRRLVLLSYVREAYEVLFNEDS